MKKILPVAMVMALLWGPAALAATYESDFGFRVDLPAGWTIVAKKGVKEKPEIVAAVFETAEKNRTLVDMPAALYNKLKEKIAGGEVEYYYMTDAPSFSISVYQDNGTIPQAPAEVEETCRSLPDELSKVSAKALKVYECRITRLVNVPAIYIVADAYAQGERYVQYMVQKAPNEVLLFTSTSTGRQDFTKMKAQFDEIMKTFTVK